MDQKYNSMWNFPACSLYDYTNVYFFQQVSLQRYSGWVQNYLISLLNMEFSYWQQQSKWYANYWIIQEQLVHYYNVYNCELVVNKKPFSTNELQREDDREKIREMFKQMLDIAAKATEEKNPDMSIIFDGIGLVLASDYVEALSKLFSMLKTAIKNDDYFSGRYLGY